MLNIQTNILVPIIGSSDEHISVEILKLPENIILIGKFTLQLSEVL